MLDRYTQILKNEGVDESPVKRTNLFDSITKSDSYFDMMLNLRLDGVESINNKEIFDNLLVKISMVERTLAKLSEDYYQLQSKLRITQNLLNEVIKE